MGALHFSPGYANVTAITLRPVGRSAPAGNVSLLTSIDGPLTGTGDTVTYGYNTQGILTSVTTPVSTGVNLVTQITALTPNGLPATIVDPNSVQTVLTCDPLDRLASMTVNPGASEAVTSFLYDAVGQVPRSRGPGDGSFLQYTWNDARRLTTVTNNTGETITYAYNLNGDVTSTTVKSWHSGNR